MKSLFKRHRVRGTLYHISAILVILSTLLCFTGVITAASGMVCTVVLFVIDYLAEMYDPHPETPGPWFKAHFHRFFNDNNEDES